jgi:hypothetical protein
MGKSFGKGGDQVSIEFFESEVIKTWEKFNQTFGMLATGDIRLRQETILKICNLGCLSKKISQAESRSSVQEEIKKFIKIKDALNDVFCRIENYLNERRNLDHEEECSRAEKKHLG